MKWKTFFAQNFCILSQIVRDPYSNTAHKSLAQVLSVLKGNDLLGYFIEPKKNPCFEKLKTSEGAKPSITEKQADEILKMLNIDKEHSEKILKNAEDFMYLYEGSSIFEVAVHIYHEEFISCLNIMILLLSQYSVGDAPSSFIRLIEAFIHPLLDRSENNNHIENLIQKAFQLKTQKNFYQKDPTNFSIPIKPDCAIFDKIKQFHINSCEEESYLLSIIILHVSCIYGLEIQELLLILKNLKTYEELDSLSVILSAGAMITLNTFARNELIMNKVSVDRFKLTESNLDSLNSIIVSDTWKYKEIKGAIMTQWLCFLQHVLIDGYDHRKINDDLKLNLSNILNNVSSAWKDHVLIYPKTFSFLENYILQFRKSKSEISQQATLLSDRIALYIDRHLIILCEGMLSDLVLFKQILRELRNQGEDYMFLQIEGRTSSTNPFELSGQVAWNALISFIITLYRDRPDSAISFWRSKESEKQSIQPNNTMYANAKQAFIKIAADVSTTFFVNIFMQLLTPLSTGKECAAELYTRLMLDSTHGPLGKVTWKVLFPAFSNIVETLSSGMYQAVVLSEAELMKTFLNLISQISRYYPFSKWFNESQCYKTLHTIFCLLLSSDSMYIKAASLKALSGICTPLVNDYKTQLQVWQMLSNSKAVPAPKAGYQVHDYSSGQQILYGNTKVVEGIIYDFEEIESHHQNYPETLAFLDLVCTLLSNPEYSSATHLLRNLGPQSLPGLRSCIQLIRDVIYLSVHLKKFAEEGQMWEMIYHCVRIFDISLGLFSVQVENFNSVANIINQKGGNKDGTSDLEVEVRNIALEPGFEVLTSIFSNTLFIQRLFFILNTKAKDIIQSEEKSCIYSVMCVHAVLRIFLRAFRLQKWFIERFLPILRKLRTAEDFSIPKTISSLEVNFAFNKEAVVSTCLLVKSENFEISYLALCVLQALSLNPIFMEVDVHSNLDRLASIIVDSKSADTIMAAFIEKLLIDEEENYLYYGYGPGDTFLEVLLGRVLRDVPFIQAQNKEVFLSTKCEEKIASLLRAKILDFFLTNIKQEIRFTLAHYLLGYEKTSCRDIGKVAGSLSKLNCLSAILSKLQGKPQESNEFFYSIYPCITGRCYELVYYLCESRLTSAQTYRYLSGNSFYHQIKEALISKADVNKCDFSDGGSAYIALIHNKAWFMDLVALEAYNEYRDSTSRKSNIGSLFLSPLSSTNDSQYEQRQILILEIISTLSFSHYPYDITPKKLTGIFSSIDLDKYLKNQKAIDIYDIKELNKDLSNCIKGQEYTYNKQKNEILKNIIDINIYRQILAARVHCASSWGKLLKVVIEGLDFVPLDVRRELLAVILQALLGKLSSGYILFPILEDMASVILHIVNRIELDSKFRSLSMDNKRSKVFCDSANLETLNRIGDIIHSPNVTVEMRGILYCAFLKIIQCEDSFARPDGTYYPCIEVFSNKLLEVVCRDALFAPGHWRAMAFSLLDAVVDLKYEDRYPIFERIASEGYLSLFVQSLSDDDANLRELFSNPNERNVHNKLAFEMKITFFIRVSNNFGKYLIERGILESISACKFIHSLPDKSGASIAICAYNEALISLLLLINSISLSLKTSHNTHKKVLDFVLNNKTELNSILKNCTDNASLLQLEKLEAVMAVYAYLAEKGIFFDEKALLDGLSVTKTLILNLISKVFDQKEEQNVQDDLVEQTKKLKSLINVNLIRFCKALVAPPKSFQHSFTEVYVFSSSLSSRSMKGQLSTPTIKIAFARLSELINDFQDLTIACKNISSKSERIQSISMEEINNIVGEDGLSSLTDAQKRKYVALKIEEFLKSKDTQASYIILSIEMLLFVTWKHLVWYKKEGDPYSCENIMAQKLLEKSDFFTQAPAHLAPTLYKLLSGDWCKQGQPRYANMINLPLISIFGTRMIKLLDPNYQGC